jgi:hypothetical protein
MVFTDESPTKETDQIEQTQEDTQTQESYLQKLVQAKGENWSNPEVLAKGKLEADGYISNLESQLTELREELNKQDYSKTLLDQLQEQAADPTTAKLGEPSNNSSTNSQNTTASLSEDDLKSLVEKTLTEREKGTALANNLSLVDQELEKSFGTEAKTKVANKAKELGMSMERMREIASESPQAFFSLIGEPEKTFSPMVQGSVRTEGVNMQNSTERDFSYYQKLRRENRNLYYSAKTQQQMFQDKGRLGEKFGA